MLRPRLSALQTARPSFANGLSFRLANAILSLANGDVEYLLSKLDGIARTFGHEASIAQAALTI
jgi:hypothetical protein